MKNQITITSLDLVTEINIFRKQDGNKSEIRHDTLLGIIRDEFEKEISLQKILESSYTNSRGKVYPMFELTTYQAIQILSRESKFVRRAIVAKLESIENPTRKIIDSTKDIFLGMVDELMQLRSDNEMKAKIEEEVNLRTGNTKKNLYYQLYKQEEGIERLEIENQLLREKIKRNEAQFVAMCMADLME